MTAKNIVVVLFSAIVLFIISFLLYFRVLATKIDWPNAFVYVASLILFGFLIILIFRYLLLIWFSFMSHFEKTFEEFDETWPRLSVLVPVYNEGEIIDA